MDSTSSDLPTLRMPAQSPTKRRPFVSESAAGQLGNYRLLRLIAEGGFAEVYLGEHIHLGTLAAIKVLHTRLDSNDLEQFRKEARIVARLRHPHIVSIHDFDVKDGTPFLVMDYAPNGTLRQRHPRGVAIAPAVILPYLIQVANALQYAHDQRLIHRDIKPENMLIGELDQILLSDFGIAIVISTHSQTAREIVGTITYMAPEQLQGKAVVASDQYSLGVVVYEWLCGECPFQGSLGEIAAQHVNTPPPPLCERVPNLSPPLEAAVMKALAKDPVQRHPSVLDFAYAFASAFHPQPLQLHPSGALPGLTQPSGGHFAQTVQATAPASPSSPEPPETLPEQAGHRQRISRRTALLGLTAAATTALAGGSVAWLVSNHHARSPFPSPTPSPSSTATPTPQGTLIHTYRGHHDSVNGLACSADGTYVASASKDTMVQVWDAATGGNSAAAYTGHTDAVTSVSWSPDEKFVISGSLDNTAKVWSTADGSNPFTYSNHTDAVNAVAWSPDGTRIASAGADKTVQVWNATDGSNPYTYSGHQAAVYTAAWSPSGSRIASAGADKTVQVWNATDGSNPTTLAYHSDTVYTVAWSPDGSFIASAGADYTVRIWKASGGPPIYTYSGHTAAVYSIAWSPDGTRIASASADKTVQVWNATDGSNPYTYKGHLAPVRAVAWLPNPGTLIVSGSEDTTVQIWQGVEHG